MLGQGENETGEEEGMLGWEELQFEVGWSGEASLRRTHLNGGLKEVSHGGVCRDSFPETGTLRQGHA